MLATRRSHRQRWLNLVGAGGALLGAGVVAVAGTPLRAQVVWEAVTPKQAEESQILVPAVNGGGGGSSGQENAVPIVWELVEEPEETRRGETKASAPVPPEAVVWEPVPSDPSGDGAVPAPETVVWEPLPSTDAMTEALAIEQEQPSRVPEPPPPPPLQALNRSIAYADGSVGPDIGWKVPNGFRWSQRWFGDAAILGGSRRSKGEDFFAWNDGDAVAIVHANLVQTKRWSLGLNTSIRSVYQGDGAAGGSTQVGEGVSSGFRIARQIGNTGGIAFGGEQIVQWDDQTDTGRNFYLMASKGWWLGNQGGGYPLLIANGGFGTGRFATNDNLKFACIDGVEQRSGSFDVDNDLCWGPIGSLSLVFNEWWGAFVEYNSNEPGAALAAISVNTTGDIPLRLTWGVVFGRKDELIPKTEKYSWVFRASLGF